MWDHQECLCLKSDPKLSTTLTLALAPPLPWLAHVSNDRIVLFWSTLTECECSSEPVPAFLITRVIVLHHNSRIRDRPTRDCCTLSQRQNGYSVVPEHPHVGPHGPNRASFFMNPMYSIARTRQCPRKSCSPRQPMAAYMWNGLQPVTFFTLVPNPNPNLTSQQYHSVLYTLNLNPGWLDLGMRRWKSAPSP